MANYRIKQIIAAKGMTIKTVAEKLGVTPQNLSNLISGKSSPNVSSLEKIAEVLEVPVASLFADYLNSSTSTIVCPYCGGRVDIKTGERK